MPFIDGLVTPSVLNAERECDGSMSGSDIFLNLFLVSCFVFFCSVPFALMFDSVGQPISCDPFNPKNSDSRILEFLSLACHSEHTDILLHSLVLGVMT